MLLTHPPLQHQSESKSIGSGAVSTSSEPRDDETRLLLPEIAPDTMLQVRERIDDKPKVAGTVWDSDGG